jgi:hypothetical protein
MKIHAFYTLPNADTYFICRACGQSWDSQLVIKPADRIPGVLCFQCADTSGAQNLGLLEGDVKMKDDPRFALARAVEYRLDREQARSTPASQPSGLVATEPSLACGAKSAERALDPSPHWTSESARCAPREHLELRFVDLSEFVRAICEDRPLFGTASNLLSRQRAIELAAWNLYRKLQDSGDL